MCVRVLVTDVCAFRLLILHSIELREFDNFLNQNKSKLLTKNSTNQNHQKALSFSS